MNTVHRFARRYVQPLMSRVILAVFLAGILSSYFFMLGFITKMTVDHVIQIRPSGVAIGGTETWGRDSAGNAIDRRQGVRNRRDPKTVLPRNGLGVAPRRGDVSRTASPCGTEAAAH